MTRRSAIGVLLGACSRLSSAKPGNLDGYLGSPRASAVLVDVPNRQLIAAGGTLAARRLLLPPGSTLKPFVLATLLENGLLRPGETFFCPGRLHIRERSFECVHPALGAPLGPELALAYSCNGFVAHVAGRFDKGELARELERFGLASPTGWFGVDEVVGRIRPAATADDQRVQALGESNVEVTAVGLALAYRMLALRITLSAYRPIREGLVGAIEFGTAQNARIPGAGVAGKTGSAVTRQGEPIAWFAGLMPISAPKVAIVVMQPGLSGGADAAPIARKILEAYQSRTL